MIAEAEVAITIIPEIQIPLPMICDAKISHSSPTQTPDVGSLSKFTTSADSTILRQSDVITLDKDVLDNAIANAKNSDSENRYFDDRALNAKINDQKTSHAPFITFDLGLSEHEIKTLDSIEITKTDAYNCFGDMSLLSTQIPDFLKCTTNADETQIAVITSLVKNLSEKAVTSFDGEAAWVALRAYNPTHDFDMPRWHTDYHFVNFGTEYEAKFVAALKGEQTLFYPASAQVRTVFRAHEEDANARTVLNDLLDPVNAVTPLLGQGAIFVVGDPSYAAIHSEPKMEHSRLFLSVLPGSHDAIGKLAQRWNIKPNHTSII